MKTSKARVTTERVSPPRSPHQNMSAVDCKGQMIASPVHQTHRHIALMRKGHDGSALLLGIKTYNVRDELSD